MRFIFFFIISYIQVAVQSAAKTDNGDNRKFLKGDDFVINSRSEKKFKLMSNQLLDTLKVCRSSLALADFFSGKIITF